MITISIIIVLVLIFTSIQVSKDSKKLNVDFNPFNSNFFIYLGFLLSASSLCVISIFLLIKISTILP